MHRTAPNIRLELKAELSLASKSTRDLYLVKCWIRIADTACLPCGRLRINAEFRVMVRARTNPYLRPSYYPVEFYRRDARSRTCARIIRRAKCRRVETMNSHYCCYNCITSAAPSIVPVVNFSELEWIRGCVSKSEESIPRAVIRVPRCE